MKMKPLLTCLKRQVKFLLYAAFLTFFTCASLFAQEQKVTGTVKSAEDNSAMPGVNVIVLGKTAGTITDGNGSFSITVPGRDAVLVFSFIGFNSQELPVGTKTVLDVTMVSASLQLGEIVVTAFGIKKEKKALTYSAQNVEVEGIVEGRELNVINSLGGKVAGLDLVRSNAGVGSSSRVVIRGNRSISGNNQPLYIVDGVPIQNSTTFQTYGEGGGMSSSDGISNINPDDIESVTVLKGPSATALYGTRANNGAILITTKKGTSRKGIGVEYSLNYSVETPVILTKFQDIYGQGSQGIYAKNSEFDWGPKMDGRMVDHWTPDVNSPKYGTQYPFVGHKDNFKNFFQMGTNLTNSLALTSGSEDVQTYFSYTNTHSKGIVEGNELKRHNLNLRITSKLSKNLSTDTKVTYFHQDVKNRVSTGDDYANPMRAILRQPSNISQEEAMTYEFRDNSGFLLQNYWNPHSNGGENPWWIVNNIPYEESRDRVLGMASLKYELLTGLSLQVRSSIDYTGDMNFNQYYNDTYTIADRGNYRTGRTTNWELNNDVLLNFNKAFGDISVNVSAGGNMLTQKWYGMSTNNTSLLKPNLFTVDNAALFLADEWGATKKLNSVYGFATFGFKNYLFLDLTGRNDWSSTLPKANWSYFYPSAGLTWVVSDMIKSLPGWLTFAKLRASLAQVGNDTDPYQLAPIFNFYTGGTNGYASRGGTKPASELKPELTTSKELGFDFRFLQNRFGVDFTWYKSNSKNQLLAVGLPVASGYNDKFINAGNIQNKGIEITLNAKPVTGNLAWDISFNFAKNNSLVVEISPDMKEYGLTGRNWMTTTKVVEGHEYGDIYIKGFIRNEAGRVLINTDGKPLVTPGQTMPGGNYNPDWIGGITNTLTYKGFDLNFSIDIRQGGYVDPRLPAFFKPAKNTALYTGMRNGLTIAQISEPHRHYDNLSTMSDRWSIPDNQYTTPIEVILASEAYFLRAEGALKGWTMGITAEAAYNMGIEMSLKYWGSTDAEILAYQAGTTAPMALPDFNTPPMSDIPVKWSANAAKNLEQVITQKWIALFPDGWEAWGDVRRTDFPKLYPILSTDNPDVPVDQRVRRVQFVPGEYSNNKTAVEAAVQLIGGQDKANVRMWWDPAK